MLKRRNDDDLFPNSKKCRVDDITWRHYELNVISEHGQQYQDATVWHWPNAPVDMIMDAGAIIHRKQFRQYRQKRFQGVMDVGLDGLAKLSDGSFHGLQAKYRTDNNVDMNDVATTAIAAESMTHKNPQNKVFVYTNTGYTEGLLDDYTGYYRRKNMNLCHLPFISTSNPNLVVDQPQDMQHTLYDEQRKALDIMCDTSRRGLQMIGAACGFGKGTILCHMISRNVYNRVVVLSPLLSHVHQTSNRMKLAAPDAHHMTISCEGERSIDDNLRQLSQHDRVVVSVVYKSIDVLIELKNKGWLPEVVIVDEAHNMVGNDMLLNYCKNDVPLTWCMTATPPIELDIPTAYSYTLEQGIDDNRITDYKVVLPCLLDDMNNDTEATNYDAMTLRAEFHATAIERKGLTCGIVYLNTIKDAKEYIDALKDHVETRYGRPFWGSVITSDIGSPNVRKALLKRLETERVPGELRVLASVRILDENIDIVPCDHVFLAEPTKNLTLTTKRRTIQRICRALRKHPTKDMGYALVWSTNDDPFPEVLTSIKQCHRNGLTNRVFRMHPHFDAVDTHVVEAEQTLTLTKHVDGIRIFTTDLEKIKALIEYDKENAPHHEQHKKLYAIFRNLKARQGGWKEDPTTQEYILCQQLAYWRRIIDHVVKQKETTTDLEKIKALIEHDTQNAPTERNDRKLHGMFRSLQKREGRWKKDPTSEEYIMCQQLSYWRRIIDHVVKQVETTTDLEKIKALIGHDTQNAPHHEQHKKLNGMFRNLKARQGGWKEDPTTQEYIMCQQLAYWRCIIDHVVKEKETTTDSEKIKALIEHDTQNAPTYNENKKLNGMFRRLKARQGGWKEDPTTQEYILCQQLAYWRCIIDHVVKEKETTTDSEKIKALIEHDTQNAPQYKQHTKLHNIFVALQAREDEWKKEPTSEEYILCQQLAYWEQIINHVVKRNMNSKRTTDLEKIKALIEHDTQNAPTERNDRKLRGAFKRLQQREGGWKEDPTSEEYIMCRQLSYWERIINHKKKQQK